MSIHKRGRQSFCLPDNTVIRAWASTAGKKESEGPLAPFFDYTSQDTHFGEASWEQAEKRMQQITLETLSTKAGIELTDLEVVLSGDLLNQCIGSSFPLRNTGIPHLGLYGACSTMAESLLLASMMVGREVLQEPVEKPDTAGEVKISVSDLHVPDNRGLPAVKGLSLEVRSGEILGIAAIEGNGQSELLEAITGMRPYSGLITVGGQDIRGLNPGQIRNLGLSHVPEDRLATGVSAQADIADNLLMGKHKTKEFTKFRFHQNKKAVRDYASRIFEKFDVRAPGVDTKVGSLSGGNMQKVVIAREFSYDADVLVISQPTRGVDIGANEFIHSRILQKRNEGAAVLLCSADLDEVFRLSDRIITIYEGNITGHFQAGTIAKADIGYYMTGDRKEAAHET